MECGSIRQKLSAYMENAVSREERNLIEEHLKSCAGCSADLADLRKTVEHIRALAEVEPPAWMTGKIMAEVREEARKNKGILRRLFFPLYIKLPLEAVAAVLVVGIALSIYRGTGPETRSLIVPPEKSAPQVTRREIPGENRTLHSPGGSELKKVPRKAAKAPVEPLKGSPENTVTTTDKIEESARDPEPSRTMQLPQGKQETAPSAPATGTTAQPRAGALEKGAQGQAVQTAPKLKAFSYEKKETPVLIVKVRELEKASKEIEKIIALKGKIIERQSHEGRRMFVIELNASRFDELSEKLKLVGDVDEFGDKGSSLKGPEENMRVRVEAVQAYPH